MTEHFLKLKSNLELDPTLAASISTRHNAVRTYLQNNHTSFKDSKLIGSVGRKTRTNPGSGKKFDIDILVISGENNGWVMSGGITPDVFLNQLYSTIGTIANYIDAINVTPQQGKKVEMWRELFPDHFPATL